MLEGYLRKRGQGPPFCEVSIWVPHIFVVSPKTFHKGGRRAGRPPDANGLPLKQHRALVAIQERLREGERVIAFLDDIYAREGRIRLLHHRSGAVCPCEDLKSSREKPSVEPWRGA